MDIDFLEMPYIFCLTPIAGGPGMTLARRIPGASGPFPYETLWMKAFGDQHALKAYFDVIWAQIYTGCWPVWASIAVAHGPEALTEHLDAVVRGSLHDSLPEQELWSEPPTRSLAFDAPVRRIRYMLSRSEDGLSINILDRFGDDGPQILWSRRFRSANACTTVFRALWKDSTAMLPVLARLLQSGQQSRFEAYIAQRVPGYRAARPGPKK